MNDSIVDEPLPSSSTVVAGTFLRKLQLRVQKLLQRTSVSFPKRIADRHVATDRAGRGRALDLDDDGGCLLQRCFDCSSERVEVPANQVLQIHWDVDLRALRRLFRHYRNASSLEPGGDWSKLVNQEVSVAGGSRLGAAGDEVMLFAHRQITQEDIQDTVNWAVSHARCSAGRMELDSTGLLRWNQPAELLHRSPAQLQSASESEWFIRMRLRAHDLILLTRREKEVLQRRPALLNLVREHVLNGDEMRNEGNDFERAEYARAKEIQEASERQAQIAASVRAPHHAPRIRRPADSEAALLTQQVQNSNQDEDMSLADDSGVTPLCNSLAS
jgi:hypothetical protein